jgi:hypothetical protein
MFMNFYDHRLSLLPVDKFTENEYLSERFVIQRIVHNQHRNPNDYGKLMIAYEGDENIRQFDRSSSKEFAVKKDEILSKIESGVDPQIYPSHAAFQITLLQPIWTGLNYLRSIVLQEIPSDSRMAKRLDVNAEFYIYEVSQIFAATLSALVLTLFILWTRREFSLSVAYLTLAGILLFCAPLTYFARNLWWMMGLWFIPMVSVFWGYSLSKNQSPNNFLLVCIGFVAGVGIFMRVSCGYEYASTVMMSALVPVVYYSVKNKSTRIEFLRAIIIIGGLALCGFLAALFHHYIMLENAGFDALGTIKSRFMTRASNANALGNSLIDESVRSSVWYVIAKYLFLPQGIAWPEIFYLAPVLLSWKKWTDKSSQALFFSMGAAFIGAISMLVILKGHAYIHGFDIVVWYLPLNILIILWGAIQITEMQASKARPR